MKPHGIYLVTIAIFVSVVSYLVMDNLGLRDDRSYLEAELIRARGLADDATKTTEDATAAASKYAMMFAELRRQVLRDRLVGYMRSIRTSTENDTEIAEAIVESADRYGIPVADAAALIKIESHFMPRARSDTGAAGLSQLVASTAAELGLDQVQVWDIRDNVDAGILYYSKRLRLRGNAETALSEYNGYSDPEFLVKWKRAREAINKRLYPS